MGEEPRPFRNGAIAIVDALGFKGIWRRHRHDVVLSRLRELASLAREEFDQLSVYAQEADNALKWTTIAFLSDTVVIAVQLKSPDECPPVGRSIHAPGVDVLLQVAGLTSAFMREALDGDPPFLYRGAIAVGDFAVEENFIVGAAVDEAAECLDAAQGAFVWLAPSATRLQVVNPLFRGPFPSHPLLPYRVPLKGGDWIDTFAVVPFEYGGAPERRDRLIQTADACFGEADVSLQVKRQNTRRFLAAAAEALRPTDEGYGAPGSQPQAAGPLGRDRRKQ